MQSQAGDIPRFRGSLWEVLQDENEFPLDSVLWRLAVVRLGKRDLLVTTLGVSSQPWVVPKHKY